MHASDELEQRIQRLRKSNEDAAIDFVFCELTTGIMNCQIARTRIENIGVDGSHAVEDAEKALHTAEKYMWKFKMRHQEFDQMTALAERLRMELDSLRAKSTPPS